MNKPVTASSKQQRIGAHFLFWTIYILFFGSIYGKYGHNFQWYFIESLCMLPFVMAATYTTVYAILPFYLRTRKLVVTVLMVVSVLFLATLGERLFLRFINGLPLTADTILGVNFLYLFLETNFMVAIAFAIKIVKKWFEQQEEKHQMEKQNLEKELGMLKAQLQPHFLFNSMNNLYSLSLGKSAKTSEGIAQMAELLQAVLYECNDSEIPLPKEIRLIENYIELERLRYGEMLDLKFKVTGDSSGWKIPPMLLFTFVENCFKHGKPHNGDNFFIELYLDVSANRMQFIAKNSINGNKRGINSGAGGVGLENARKRLDIIYPDKFRLDTSSNDKIWTIFLEIER
jgi:two-component system, LytTR family, sensor kinase